MHVVKTKDRSTLPKHIWHDGVKWLLVVVKIILDSLSVWAERQNKFTFFLSTIVVMSYLYILTGQINFIFDKQIDLSDAADGIAGAIVVVETVSRRVLSIVLAKKITNILSTIYYDFWPSNINGPEMNKLLTRRSWIVLTAVGIYTTSALFWATQSLTVPLQLHASPLRSKFTFPDLDSPYYEMVYVWQGVLCAEIAINICGFDLFFISIIWTCVAQFILLREYIRQNFIKAAKSGIIRSREKTEAWNLMLKCIKHHCVLIQTTKNIEAILTVFILMLYIGTIGTVCLSGFLLTVVRKEVGRPLTYFCGHMGQIFMYCFIGHELIRESMALSDAIFECGWHLSAYEKDLQKSLVMVMLRAQRPITITLGGFGVLSLDSYMKVVDYFIEGKINICFVVDKVLFFRIHTFELHDD
ncbi:hypothetical protein RN001_014473 [Aquatica leii]|uniref:Odorant receptor n=1 Tax=Aquatica leii TaxID=1421715 RepID=A0AAN7SBN1_9COLE|nr:hypothetical protein RN001_014473 [Aquatica leii]